MSSLQSTISVDRKQGRTYTSVGYRNASVALGIYFSAQRNGAGVMRKKLVKRVRLATRWAHLGGSQPPVGYFELGDVFDMKLSNSNDGQFCVSGGLGRVSIIRLFRCHFLLRTTDAL
jgi:hypothetical protein